MLLSIFRFKSFDNNYIQFTYTPQCTYKFTIEQEQNTVFTSTKYFQEEKIFLVSSSYGIIYIFDEQLNIIELNKQISINGFINGIEATIDRKIILLAIGNEVRVYKNENWKLTLLNVFNFQEDLVDIIGYKQENIFYLIFNSGNISAYIMENNQEITLIGAISTDLNNIKKEIISPDGRILYILDEFLGMLAYYIDYNKDKKLLSFKLIGKQSEILYSAKQFKLLQKDNFMFLLDSHQGLLFIDLNPLLQRDLTFMDQPMNFLINYYLKNFTYFNSQYATEIAISPNENLIFVAVVSSGIYIFDIQNVKNPLYFQKITYQDEFFSINFTLDGLLFYVFSRKSILIYEQQEQNLNDYFPNLFNKFQKLLFTSDVTDQINNNLSIIQAMNLNPINNQYCIFLQQQSSLIIQEINNNNKTLCKITLPTDSQLIYQTVSTQSDFIYLALKYNNKSFVYVYNLGDLIEVKLISFIEITQQSSLQKEGTINLKLSANGKQILATQRDSFDILLFSSQQYNSNDLTLTLKSNWMRPYSIKGECINGIVLDESNYIIGAIKGFGIVVLNTREIKMKLVNQVKSFGGYFIDSYDQFKYIQNQVPQYPNQSNFIQPNSEIYNSFAYVSEGSQGITIYNIQNLPDVTVESQIRIEGIILELLIGWREMYLITNKMEEGNLQLIDVRDKTQPKLVEQFYQQQQETFNSLITSNQDFLFIYNNNEIRQIPLTSITIHTSILYQAAIKNNIAKRNILKNSEQLLVGEEVDFFFQFLYPIQKIQVVDIFYYKNYQLQKIPAWMSYDLKFNKLTLNPNKSAEGDNLILIKSAVPINSSQFIYNKSNDGENVSSEQAKQIFSQLKKNYFLDENNIADENYCQKQIKLNIENFIGDYTLLQKLVQQTLSSSIFYNPVRFSVGSSLKLDLSSPSQIIQSYSDNANIILTISSDDQQSQFILNKNLFGVLATISEFNKTSILLQGSILNINNVLSKKVVFNPSKNFENQYINIKVEDDLNNQQFKQVLLKECTFIQLISKIKIDPNNTIQNQFNSKYANGEINKLQDFFYDFSSSSFIKSQNLDIEYTFSINSQNDNFVQIPSNTWINCQQLNNFSFRISGFVPSSILVGYVKIKVKAFDGFNEAEDILVIKISNIPFSNILHNIVSIIFPIIAIIFFYQNYRCFLFCKGKNNVHQSTEFALINKKYRKVIPIIGQEILQGHALFNKLLTFYDLKNQKRPQHQDITQHVKKYMKLKSILSAHIPIRKLKLISDKELENKQLQITLKKLISLPKYKHTTKIEENYLNEDGSLFIQRILKDIYLKSFQIKIDNIFCNSKDFLTEFKNQNSLTVRAIRGISARYFLSMDEKSNIVYKYIKSYCKQNIQLEYSKNEWYKYIVNIEDTGYSSSQYPPHNLPILSIKDEVANSILIDLQIHNQTGLPFIPKFTQGDFGGINFHLIRELLFADAMGFNYKKKQAKKCFGESIHLKDIEIQSVEVYKQINQIKQNIFCKQNNKPSYVKLSCSKNNLLPDWMKMEIVNNMIILTGIPQLKDRGEIYIRIFNNKQQLIKEIKLVIDHDSLHSSDNINQEQSQQLNEQNKWLEQLQLQLQSQSTTHRNLFLTMSDYRYPISPSNSGIPKDVFQMEESLVSRKRSSSHFKKQLKYSKFSQELDIKDDENNLKNICSSGKLNRQNSHTIKLQENNQVKDRQKINQLIPKNKEDFELSCLNKNVLNSQLTYNTNQNDEEDTIKEQDIYNSCQCEDTLKSDEHISNNNIQYMNSVHSYHTHKPNFQQ